MYDPFKLNGRYKLYNQLGGQSLLAIGGGDMTILEKKIEIDFAQKINLKENVIFSEKK